MLQGLARRLPHAWPAVVWTRRLFPGPTPAADRIAWLHVVLLFALPAVLLYPSQAFHLLEPDEGRYAEIAREMLARGEWVVPALQGEPYLDKPPLLYWLVMLSYWVLGVHEWSARLAPALAMHGSILLTYFIGRRGLGERSAFWGALLLTLAPAFLGMGRLLILDGLLTFWVTLSLLAGFEAIRCGTLRWRWWLLAAVGCGLAILTKGPIGLVLLVPPMAGHLLLTGTRTVLTGRALLAFVMVVLALPLPWFVAVAVREPTFLRYFFWEHNVQRFADPFDHIRPFWFFLPILALGLLPGSLLAGPFVRFLCSRRPEDAHHRPPQLGFLLLAGGWCVFFFSLSGCKLPTYILPAFPPLALALGVYVAASRWSSSTWSASVVGVTVVLLGLAHHVALPWYAAFRSPMGRPELVTRHCDEQTPVLCYPRNCDSVAFYLGRENLRSYRSKQTPEFLEVLKSQPRTVVLLSHRSSLEILSRVLPPEVHVVEVVSFQHEKGQEPLPGWHIIEDLAGDTPWGLCHLIVIERRDDPSRLQ